MNAYSLENPAFASLLVYGSLLIFKTMLLIPITIYHRMTKGSVPSQEDAEHFSPNNKEKQKQLLRPNESVERVRILVKYFAVLKQAVHQLVPVQKKSPGQIKIFDVLGLSNSFVCRDT